MWVTFSFSSHSIAISGHCFAVLILFCCRFVLSPSSELEDSIAARCFFFCSFLSNTLFCSPKKLRYLSLHMSSAGLNFLVAVLVCAVSLITLAALRVNSLANFEPLVRSQTRTVGCKSFSKYGCCSSKFGSSSGTTKNISNTFDFTVFGPFRNCFSEGSHPSSTYSERIQISDKPDLSFFKTICLFARSCSFTVRISCSV